LDLVAGRDLHEEELRSLRVLTELVTAAVVNANLFAAQQDAVRRLRDLDALKTVFLSTASHELRTPATAIGGFASLLEQRWEAFPEDRRREMVQRIAANARSLGAVVEDLLDFSLLDRREQPLPVTPTDLGPLVRGVVDRLSPLFGDHRIEVRVGTTPPLVGEQNALERVVTNLLTNAAKFSPTGTTISVAEEQAAGGGRLTVCDQGPGVPEADRTRIFTRFYRGSGQAVVQTRGVGIGLSVVMELVERLGGTIEVDDAPGGGARFAIWLPEWAPADGAGDGDVVAPGEVHDATTS
jgi:signal transduction histidine kinase